jgi:outer membrane protein assembly factor BamB
MRNRKELSVLFMLILLLLCSCGGGKGAAGNLEAHGLQAGELGPDASPQDSVGLSARDEQLPIPLDTALGALAALTAPPDTDADQFAGLQRELSRLLEARIDRAGLSHSGGSAGNTPAAEGRASRSISAAPQDERDRVALTYSDGALRWHYRNTGDYDQNGEVNAADLIPLAKLLGTTGGGPFEFASQESVVDGDGNGEINIGDVTPIAQHYGTRVTGYGVYGSSSQLDYPGDDPFAANGAGTQTLGNQDISAGQPDPQQPNGRLLFSFATPQNPGMSYWLRSLDGAQAGMASQRIGIDNWTSYQMDNRNSGQSPFIGPQSGILRWSRDFHTSLMSAPALTAAGKIIIGTANGDLHALDGIGNTQWTVELENMYSYVPVIGPQGDIYLSTKDDTLLSVSPEGLINWRVEGSPSLYRWNTPAVADNGNIYIGLEELGLAAYSDAGDLLWTVPMNDGMQGAPAISPDGRIIAGREELVAVNPDGSLGWKSELEARCVGSISLDKDGVLAYFDLYGRLNRLDADGHPLTDPAGLTQDFGSFRGCPVRAEDDSIFATSFQRYLAKLDAAGNIEWNYATELGLSNPAVVDAAGRTYFAGDDGLLCCLSPQGRLQWSYQTKANVSASPVINARGELLYCTSDGRLLCFGDPLPVQGLTALPDPANQRIMLGWEGSDGSAGYRLQLRRAGQQPAAWQDLAAGLSADSRSFAHDQGLPGNLACQPGVDYQYRIAATYPGLPANDWSSIASGRLESASAEQAQWAALGNDQGRSGYTQNLGATRAELLWQQDIGGNLSSSTYFGSSPVLGSDGTVYITGNDKLLHAYWPDGSLRWEVEYYNPAITTPALDQDGNIYIGLLDGIICYYPDGGFRWNYPTTQPVSAAVLVTAEQVVFGCRDGLLRALTRDGELLWQFDTGNIVETAPSQSPAGRILCTNGSGTLFQLDDKGHVEWEYREAAAPAGSAAVGMDGSVYFIDGHDMLHAVSSSGQTRWTFELEGQGRERIPVIGPDGSIYAGGTDGELHRINPEGISLRTYIVDGTVVSPVALDGAGNIFCGTLQGRMLALDSNGAYLWNLPTDRGIISSPAISASGNIYIGALNNRIYAFGVGNGN